MARIDNYELMSLVGSGANGEVYLCRDVNTDAQYAIKVMVPDSPQHAQFFTQMVEQEVNTLKRLSHPLTVRLISESAHAELVKRDGRTKNVMYIVMEFCPNGELIEVLYYTGKPFAENIVRYLFKQLLEALGAVHAEGLVHRDIKPENILFDADYNLKLADFGFATLAEGREGNGLCQTNLGTPGYKAPEIYMGEPYSGEAADLFASGVILFIMYNHNPPFVEANPTNPYYRRLYANPQAFWKANGQAKPEGYFSPDFQDLVNKMLALQPTERLSMAQILAHPWMQGTTATREEFLTEIQQRHAMVQQIKQQQANAARNARQGADPSVAAVHRGGNEYRSSGPEEEPERDMKPYTPARLMTQFFSTSTPEELFFAISEYFKSVDSCKVTPSQKHFSFKVEIAKPTGPLAIKATITSAGDVRAVTFRKTTGNLMDLAKIYNHLLEQYPFLPDGEQPSN